MKYFFSTIIKIAFYIITSYLILACENVNELALQSYLLEDKWIEQEPLEIIQFEGTNYTIEFTQDSFFLKRNYWTDALDPENSCLNGHTDYFKGTYQLTANQIHFNGQYTDENFIVTDPVCDRAATYEASFEYEQIDTDVIVLNPEQEVYFQIRLEREK